jgi:hypothetical protein
MSYPLSGRIRDAASAAMGMAAFVVVFAVFLFGVMGFVAMLGYAWRSL